MVIENQMIIDRRFRRKFWWENHPSLKDFWFQIGFSHQNMGDIHGYTG
jgi:hypothetical protein